MTASRPGHTVLENILLWMVFIVAMTTMTTTTKDSCSYVLGFVLSPSLSTGARKQRSQQRQKRQQRRIFHKTSSAADLIILQQNVYDDWRSDAVVDTMHLDEENVEMCLQEFIDSDYGKQMFGKHEVPASIGITGSIEFVEISGPEVVLSLRGKFWHRRETVLGRAAMWLNARMPEITDVNVNDLEELKDFEEILDDFGEVLFRKDKRAPDYNGDRETMEYQGMDPDVRGPFPQGPMGPGSMMQPV